MQPNMEALELRVLSERDHDRPADLRDRAARRQRSRRRVHACPDPAGVYSQYQFNGHLRDGPGETIAIVDAYNDPNIQSDLNTFDTQFGLPSTTVSVVNETGGTSSRRPIRRAAGSWRNRSTSSGRTPWRPGRTSCWWRPAPPAIPTCSTAVSYASQHANVVSMSWGGSEFSGETSYDS